MGRYYKRRFYRSGVSGRDKYSVEQRAFLLSTDSTTGNGGEVVVSATTLQGMRKVKHLTVSMAQTSSTGSASAVYWALVYVPQGTTASPLTVGGSSLYEPNQFVMSCGVFDFDAGPCRVHCPLSRNLNSGDNISLIVHTDSGQQFFDCCVRYAITLQ